MRAMGRRWRQASALALWGLAILLAGAFGGSEGTAGQELRHAGLVVSFGDGHTETRCVEFTEEEISGAELLRRSGFSVVFSGSGGFGEGVCRIDDTGCSDPSDCFCQCRGAGCAYWAYFAFQDGEWRYQSVGASQRQLHDGDVDGWVWGSGRTSPEPVTFGELCAVAAPTAPPPRPSPTAAAGPPGESSNADSGARAEAPSGSGEPAALPSRPESVASPVQTEASGANDVPTSARPTAGATPPARGEVPQAAVRGDDSENDGREGEAAPGATTADEAGGGPPAGLIAFGVVAGLLAAAIGGLALRRRLGG